MVGDVFRIAFERRHTYDLLRPTRATVALWHRHEPAGEAPAPRGATHPRRGPARGPTLPPVDLAERVSDDVDAVGALAACGRGGDVAAGAGAGRTRAARLGGAQLRGGRRRPRRARRHRAVAHPPGSRTTPRTRGVQRERTGRQHREPRCWEDRVVSDDFDPLRRLRPDRIEPDDPGDPAVFSRAKEQFMSTIDEDHIRSRRSARHPTSIPGWRTATSWPPSTTSRACSSSSRTARRAMEFDGKYLCWLRVGTRRGDARPRQHGRPPHPQPARCRADHGDDERLRPRHRRPLRARGGRGRQRSRWSSTTPSSASGATRPPISRATAGTSASASTTSGPAVDGRPSPGTLRPIDASHFSGPRRVSSGVHAVHPARRIGQDAGTTGATPPGV